ncbi:MAG: DUF1080 domain-containing protein [Phaeodactylibacter sp.]|nr:DUF1080 domain-containing protein [Phaeodactylibacter sp.]
MKIGIITAFLLSSVSIFAQELFNGKDLTGWQAYGTEQWYVEEGLLISESGPDKEYGYLCTQEYFDDFTLTLSFLQEANGNSGVFFRSTVDGTKVQGWQVEVAPPGKHTGGIYESYGRGWLIKPDPDKEAILKENTWNTLKIKAKGGRVSTWLNGKRMIKIKDEKIGDGKGGICLQIHDGGGIKVKWKDLKMKSK